MSIEIEVLNGDASWPQAKPLYEAVWPPEVMATLPWKDVIFAHADLRVFVLDDSGQPVELVLLFNVAHHLDSAKPQRSSGSREVFLRNLRSIQHLLELRWQELR